MHHNLLAVEPEPKPKTEIESALNVKATLKASGSFRLLQACRLVLLVCLLHLQLFGLEAW